MEQTHSTAARAAHTRISTQMLSESLIVCNLGESELRSANDALHERIIRISDQLAMCESEKRELHATIAALENNNIEAQRVSGQVCVK